jgi:hypothetical protein
MLFFHCHFVCGEVQCLDGRLCVQVTLGRNQLQLRRTLQKCVFCMDTFAYFRYLSLIVRDD